MIDTLILHYTGMQSAEAAIERLRDPAARVSSHYLVDEDGAVLALVPEERRAWHAGISCWRGRTGLNDVSIGIEIVNPGHEWGYRDFPVPQMAAVRVLCLAILSRHPIPARNVVAHSDVAPERKQDPGERFDWQGLARSGIGLFPARGADDSGGDPAAGDPPADDPPTRDPSTRDPSTGDPPLGELATGNPPIGDIAPDPGALGRTRRELALIGYSVAAAGPLDPPLAAVLRAFQRHWRPRAVTGQPDADTRDRVRAVARLVEQTSPPTA